MNPMFAQYGMQQPQGKQFNAIKKKLSENYRTESVDLEPSEIQISSIQNNVSTCGAADGNIDITILGGTPPYIFNWSSGQNTEDINNLSSGIFTLTVTDANLCTSIHSVTIIEPVAPTISYTCSTAISFITGMDAVVHSHQIVTARVVFKT